MITKLQDIFSSRMIYLGLLMICFTHIAFAQVKESGGANDEGFTIIITNKYHGFLKTKMIEYSYKGKRYTVGYWAKDFMNIVESEPLAAKEVRKYRTKMLSSTILGGASAGFMFASVFNEFDLTYIDAFVGTSIAAMILANSRDKNIIKAAEYYTNPEKDPIQSNLYNHQYNNIFKEFNASKFQFTLTYKF